MVAAFKRFYIPAVRLDTPVGPVVNLDGNGIYFEWDIFRDNTNTVDQGTITIFNLSEAFRKLLFESWLITQRASSILLPVKLGWNVNFTLGWEGLPELLMKGDVWNIVPSDRTGGTDVMTVLSIGDGNKSIRDQTVGRSFVNVNIVNVLDYLVGLPPAGNDVGGGGLGLLFTPESKAVITAAASELPITTWGNIVQGSNTREAVDVIMATLGLEWRVYNGEFIAMRGGTINRPGVILQPNSGLIDYTARDDGGVSVNALANPRIEPGLQIFVKDNLGRNLAEPVYRVESVHFFGDTEGASLMEIEAKRVVILG